MGTVMRYLGAVGSFGIGIAVIICRHRIAALNEGFLRLFRNRPEKLWEKDSNMLGVLMFGGFFLCLGVWLLVEGGTF